MRPNIKKKFFVFLLLTVVLSGCSNAQDYLKKGNKEYVAKNYNKAIVSFQKVLKKDKSIAEAYNQLSLSYLAINDIVNAYKIILDGLSSFPNNADILSTSHAVLLKKAELTPNDIQLILRLAKIYKDNNENDKARDFLNWVIDLDPENQEAIENLANLYETVGNYDLALTYYQKVSPQSSFFGTAQDKISTIKDTQGYKGANWSSSLSQVSSSLGTILTFKEYNNWFFDSEGNEYVFLELWGLPKDSSGNFGSVSMGNDEGHKKDALPANKFKLYKTSEGDYSYFYDDKFAAYFFEVKAVNYSTYYDNLVTKYGQPSSTRNFSIAMPQSSNTSNDILVNEWDRGGTKVFIIKDHTEFRSLGFSSTGVYLVYFSSSIFDEILSDVQKSASAIENEQDIKKQQGINEDLKKIQ